MMTKDARISRLISAVVFLLLFSSPPTPCAADQQDVVAIKGHDIKPFNDTIAGFSASCGCRVTELLSEDLDRADVMREVRAVRPRAVFAVGTEALSLVDSLRTIPVIYAMVPNPQPASPERNNQAGVGMNLPPEKYLAELRKVMPDVRRVGLVYDPQKTGPYVKKAVQAALAMGIDLITKEVRNPREAIAAIRGLKGEIELFWMLPDSTVITQETVEFLVYFSFENKVPLLAFAEKYVAMGALMSLGIDDADAGRQAGELYKRVLEEGVLNGPRVIEPEKVVLSINLKTAEKMSIPIRSDIVTRAKVVR